MAIPPLVDAVSSYVCSYCKKQRFDTVVLGLTILQIICLSKITLNTKSAKKSFPLLSPSPPSTESCPKLHKQDSEIKAMGKNY